MRKTWLVVEQNYDFHDPRPAPLPPARVAGHIKEKRDNNGIELLPIPAIVCYSLAEASEFVKEYILDHPRSILVVYEGIGLYETAPSVPVYKAWDANGELIV